MKQNKKDGRVPLEQKNSGIEYEFGSKARSMMDIPEDCKAELNSAGLEGRWIDVVELKKNHGWHKREWVPHKFSCLGKSATNPFGATEGQYDGYLIRKQLVLAAKPKEKADARRAYTQARAKAQANPGKHTIEEFKTFIKENSKSTKVLEWDEDDEEQVK